MCETWEEVSIESEPTGHYWFTFVQYIKRYGMKLAFVNPASIKKAKEPDDNSPKKTSRKDSKTITNWLLTEGTVFLMYQKGICRFAGRDIKL